MRTAITALLIGTLALSACGRIAESRFNPFNWFGRSQEGPASLAPDGGYASGVIDNRALVTEVTGLEVTRTPGGAVLAARGLPPTQGWWDAELVAETEEPVDGVLTYAFRVAEPRTVTRVSTPQSREVTAGLFLSDQTLEGVRRIVVLGATNSRSSTR